jgi:hypothetical protein
MTRFSATAVPVAPTPTEIHSWARSSAAEDVGQTVVEGPVEVAGRRVEEVEDHPVGADQAPGLGDHVVEDLLGLAQDRDPRGDLAQRLLRLRPPAEGLARDGRARRSGGWSGS